MVLIKMKKSVILCKKKYLLSFEFFVFRVQQNLMSVKNLKMQFKLYIVQIQFTYLLKYILSFMQNGFCQLLDTPPSNKIGRKKNSALIIFGLVDVGAVVA